MLRRDFLRRLTTTAAGLLVADDALELLSHRKVWAGHDFGYDPRMTASYHVAMYRAELERNWPNEPVRHYKRIAVDNYASFSVAELQSHWRKLRALNA